MLFGCTVVSLLDSKIPVYRRMALYIPDLPAHPTDRDAPPAEIHCGHYAGAGETDMHHTLLLSPRYLVAGGLATVRVCLRRGRGHPPPHPPRACIVPSYTHNFILQRGLNGQSLVCATAQLPQRHASLAALGVDGSFADSNGRPRISILRVYSWLCHGTF